MFKEGDEVAYRGHGRKGWNVATVERLTPTQAVLTNGARVRQKDRVVIGESGGMYVRASLYSEVASQVELWKERQAKEAELSRQRSAVATLHDRMRVGNYQGFTADELASVAEVMKEAIAARDSRT